MAGANTRAALGTVTRGEKDGHGNPVMTVSWSFYDGIWWPGSSTEAIEGQDQVTWNNTVCLPTGTTVQAVDVLIPVVTVDEDGQPVYAMDGITPLGDQFVVDGQPAVWPSNAAGWRHPYSVVVTLTRKTG